VAVVEGGAAPGEPLAGGIDPVEVAAGEEGHAGRLDLAAEGLQDGGGGDDGGAGDEEGLAGGGAHLGLQALKVGGGEAGDRDAMLLGAGLQQVQLRGVRGLDGDQQLAGAGEGELALLAVGRQFHGPLGADPGLQGPRRVVDAAVQDAAVATAGMAARGGLFFQDGDLLVGIAALEFARQSQADDAGADDEEVGVHGVGLGG
jgi:hypothetical protein